MTDTQSRAALVERLEELSDAMTSHLEGSPGDFAVARWALEDEARDIKDAATALREFSVRTCAMDGALKRIRELEGALKRIAAAETDGLDLARDSMVLERAIKAAKAALSQ